MRSIRTRLLVSLGCCGALSLVLSFTIVYLVVSRALRENFDQELRREAQAFSLMAEVEGERNGDEEDGEYEDRGDDTENNIHFEFAEMALPGFGADTGGAYYQVYGASDRVLARSPSLGARNLPRLNTGDNGIAFQDLLLPSGEHGRLVVQAFYPKIDDEDGESASVPRLVLIVARSTGERDATLAKLFACLSIAALSTLSALVLLVWVSVRRALLPLDAICLEITQVNSDELGYAFESAHRPVELHPICERLNELLARLEESFGRERRFTADVAHELRTPVAELRALAEVSLKREGIRDAERRSMEDAREIALGMGRVITALLDITRCNAGQMNLEKSSIDLVNAVESAWGPFEEGAREKELTVALDFGELSNVESDAILFGTVLTNIFSNAIAYTPVGGVVRLTLGATPHEITVCLENDTDGLTQEDVDRMYDTFWRKNGHDANPHHAGVGLSLVKAIAGVLNMAIEGVVTDTGRFRITLRHPL